MAGFRPKKPATGSRQWPQWGMKSGSANKAECRLWVQKGDDRRNAPQRARCAVGLNRSRGNLQQGKGLGE